MLKRLLVFFKIIDEVKVPVQMQWKERPRAEKPQVAKRQVRQAVVVQQQSAKQNIQADSNIILDEKRSVNNKEKIRNLANYTQDYKEYCLEKTSNQHTLKASDYKIIDRKESTETFFIPGDVFVSHNEHKILRIEKGYFIKYIQQEYNPITQLNENAYD